MAAEIHSRPQSSRPALLSKIEGHQDAVTAALLIPKEDGVITASEDRTIRVWLKRDSGQYWPSIYHTMASPCSAMAYHHDSRRVFVGQDNGAVMEFHVSEDFNKMNFIKTYPAHQNRVSAIIFSLAAEWVISTGHDKCVSWMCTRSGNMLGRHFFTSWASCLQYDFDTQYAFVGDYSGQITLLKLEQNTCSVITTLKGHEGSIACLWWDPLQRLLFSGASDNSIIMWDIGGRKGRTLLLQGHHDRVQALCYLQLTRQLVSCSSDGGIAVWNMDVSREEAPQWLESDSCQKCEQPFFWNIKQMWDTKTLGLRQHHCRKCGQAVCGRCSSKRSSYPVMGFEFQVRVCDSCYDSIKDEDRTSLATFHEGKHNISHMSMDVARGLMVTCGTDRIVKIWDMTPVVGCSLAAGFALADPGAGRGVPCPRLPARHLDGRWPLEQTRTRRHLKQNKKREVCWGHLWNDPWGRAWDEGSSVAVPEARSDLGETPPAASSRGLRSPLPLRLGEGRTVPRASRFPLCWSVRAAPCPGPRREASLLPRGTLLAPRAPRQPPSCRRPPLPACAPRTPCSRCR